MSNWYSVRLLTRKDVMIQAESEDEAMELAVDEFSEIGAQVQADVEARFEPGDRRVDQYIDHADEVLWDD